MVTGRMSPPEASLDRPFGESTNLFVNRELSFLAFNQLIVDEASDPNVPLLERLKFVAIVSANLDEFFMVRVAGLKQQLKSGVLEAGPDGMLPSEQLHVISERVARQVETQVRILQDDIIPALAREGIRILRVAELPRRARADLSRVFDERMFPMLTPLAVDPGHPFPFLKNRSLNLAVHLLPEAAEAGAFPLLAVVQVPSLMSRFVDVPADGLFAVVFVEDLIQTHVDRLFPGMRILECVPFRVIRNWDLSFDTDEQEDLIETVQKELRRRWRLDAVRLQVNEASATIVNRLSAELGLSSADVMMHRGPLALVDLLDVYEQVGRSDLRDQLFQPVLHPAFRESDNIFQTIAQGDVLLHHPYESYEPVLDLLEQSARDSNVLAIKQTLYRVNRDSPILSVLMEAAENGKQVTALVELKARFDEETNLQWAQTLEKAGVHVVYGMIGLKTHCKVTLVVRREVDGPVRYVHLGTGNYNEKTAKVYSDLSYFTCRKDVGVDLSMFFNRLTGYAAPPAWKKLVVAPQGLRPHIREQIEATREAAERGRPARIIIKTNALVDAETIEALCQASQSGVEVILLVRGPCCLRVGIPGVSDQITVRVLIDRFLEHSRILYFSRDDEEQVYLTSTDIMPRNFDRRVEVMLPIDDKKIARRIVDEILSTELMDDTKAAVLTPLGRYVPVARSRERPVRAQARFIALAKQRRMQWVEKKASKK